MTPTEVEQALVTAETRGYLLMEEQVTDPATPEVGRALDEWNRRCEGLARHRILVLWTGWGLWRVLIAFDAGVENELQYVLSEFALAFVRRLGAMPAEDEPEAWYGSTSSRATAEALAAELAIIDAQARDPVYETVFEVHHT
jgi:hypothetical protein